jgi:hypothetical protein
MNTILIAIDGSTGSRAAVREGSHSLIKPAAASRSSRSGLRPWSAMFFPRKTKTLS